MDRPLSDVLIGVLQWTIAIVSIAGTLALIGWIIAMFFKKDAPRK